MTLKYLGLLLSAVAAVAIIGRILWLMANRVPVMAHSTNTDVLGDSRHDDPLNPPLTGFTPLNEKDVHLDYTVDGKLFETDVLERSVDGIALTAPDDLPILWVDPNEPAVITRAGPGAWVLALLVVGGVAAALLQLP